MVQRRLGTTWLIALGTFWGWMAYGNGIVSAAESAYTITIKTKADANNPKSYAPARFDFTAEVKDKTGKTVDPKTLDIRWIFGDFFPGTKRSKGYDFDTLNPTYLYADAGNVTVQIHVRSIVNQTIFGMTEIKLSIKKPDTEKRKFYAAPNGLEKNPGTLKKPWGNLHAAVAQLQPGDTLFLRSGTYDISKTAPTKGFKALLFQGSGTPQKPITIRSYPGEKAIITNNYTSATFFMTKDYIHIADLTIEKTRNAIFIGRGKGLVFDGLTIRHVKGKGNQNTVGFYPHHMTESVIRNGRYHDIWMGTGAAANSTAAMFYLSNHNLVENNEVYDTGLGFFDKDNGADNIFRYSFIHDVKSFGIHRATQGGRDTLRDRIYGNIIARAQAGIGFWPVSAGEMRGDLVLNNTFIDCRIPFRRYSKKGYNWHDQRLWNNISVGIKKTYTWGGVYTYSDYNVIDVGMTGMSFSPPGTIKHKTLKQWQADTNLDKHSVTVKSVNFIVAKPKLASEYKLPKTSSLRQTKMLGRFGEEMRGAYMFDDVIVGIPTNSASSSASIATATK